MADKWCMWPLLTVRDLMCLKCAYGSTCKHAKPKAESASKLTLSCICNAEDARPVAPAHNIVIVVATTFKH
eukprot:6210391-Pleurochrysis_carterae.AAC.1